MSKDKALFFATQWEFRAWLERHHANATELTVGFYRVNSGKPSMNWSESVDQAICFGWIDSVRKTIDGESYSIRFTPRKNTSNWSTINIDKVERLTKAGLMTPAGMKAFTYKSEDKSGVYSHENETKLLDAGLVEQFSKDEVAWEFFSTQAPSYIKGVTHWIMSARQETTRQSRLEKTITASRQHKRLS